MKRRVFFSFHYKPDNSRAAQVRNIGVVDGNRPATDNDWEKVKKGGDKAIKRWIAEQMKGRSCTVVLVGTNTAGRKWVKYEIIKSWNDGMGVAGIHIHGLKDLNEQMSRKGPDPFSSIEFDNPKKKISSIVQCCDPAGRSSKERYAWIERNLSRIIEKAITIRNQNLHIRL